MRIKSANRVAGLILAAALAAASPFTSAQQWSLPKSQPVKDDGPRTYRFTVEYTTASTKGDILRRQRLTGDYTRGLSAGDVMWKNVTQSDVDGPTAPYGAAQKRDFMEGFRYHNDLAATFKPDFFKGFPPTAVFERNLIWDTGMIEEFGQAYFNHLKLNEPYHLKANEDVNMPDVGTFQNRDIVLTWTGRSQRNGQDCAVIDYQAFLNPLEIANAGMSLKGRSNYWGQIWVSLATRKIEYGTISEQVVGDLKLSGQDTTMVIDVLRTGDLKLLDAK